MSNLFSQSQQIELRGYMRINILSTLQRFVTNNKVVFVNRSRPPSGAALMTYSNL